MYSRLERKNLHKIPEMVNEYKNTRHQDGSLPRIGDSNENASEERQSVLGKFQSRV